MGRGGQTTDVVSAALASPGGVSSNAPLSTAALSSSIAVSSMIAVSRAPVSRRCPSVSALPAPEHAVTKEQRKTMRPMLTPRVCHEGYEGRSLHLNRS